MRDHFGEISIAKSKLWGTSTQRALQNLPNSSEKWSLGFYQNLILLKKACALANRDCQVLSPEKASRIANACDVLLANQQLIQEHFPLSLYQSAAGTSINMNTNEVIANLANQDAVDPIDSHDDVNRSQSTNDVFPSAGKITLAQNLKYGLLPELEALKSALIKLSQTFAHLPKPGRTHLQDAVALTLGDEFGSFAQNVKESIDGLLPVLQELTELPIGGSALGNAVNVPKGYQAKVLDYLNGPNFTKVFESLLTQSFSAEPALIFKSSPNLFSAQSNQYAVIRLSAQLRTLATVFQKMVSDLRLMNSGPNTGLAEIKLPALQDGSSIMPGKVNPIIPEMVMMVNARVIGNDSTVVYASFGSDFELNPISPLMFYVTLESLELLQIASKYLTEKCLLGIEPNEEHMAKLAELSQANITLLSPEQGYEGAYKLSKISRENGRTSAQAVNQTNGQTNEPADVRTNPKFGADFKDKSKVKPNAKGELGEEE